MNSKLTPMMAQYSTIKKEYSDCILLFRLGDFYEMFGDDAKIASKLLEITLTARDQGRAGKIPMCGVPHHAADGYIAKLVANGLKVAICEQVEDPKEAKGVVKREVVRVISPGTIIDSNLLAERANNYLVALYQQKQTWGLSYLDVSTGEFAVTQVQGEQALRQISEELFRLQPAELIYPEVEEGEAAAELAVVQNEAASTVKSPAYTPYRPYAFSLNKATEVLKNHFNVSSLEGYGCAHLPIGISAAGALLSYVEETQKRTLDHINKLNTYSLEHFMPLDPSTRRNLELVETIRGGKRQGTLLWVLDKTETAMGGRTLRQWLESPLVDPTAINYRLDGVAELYSDSIRLDQIRQSLNGVYDLERLISRVSYGVVNARELLALAMSCAKIPEVKVHLVDCSSRLLSQLQDELDPLTDLTQLITTSIVDDPPISLREGGIIKPGYSSELDELRQKAHQGKQWISSLQQRERERTGIKSLKVGFNKVFGYYIEVTKSNLDAVPQDYLRKQTLVNAERFIIPELKEWEAAVLGAEERIQELEYRLFVQIRNQVNAQVARVQQTARAIGTLDALASLALVARNNGYVRPEVTEDFALSIQNGRHPVVEVLEPTGSFVPNDCQIDGDNYLLLLTGPNMAGKSTYLRQVALITLMAQIGSFVPAEAAKIGVVDRIFTRVGAADDLATGQSTFMVEMNEVANILNHATHRSLIILDEVGRGTSTFDGLSIAWAISEYLLDPEGIGAKTLFATHYHELTQLAQTNQGIVNLSVAVRRERGKVVFLRKIVPGAADKSYGIEVAKLAGLPEPVIHRAQQILTKLESTGTSGQPLAHLLGGIAKDQLTLFVPVSEPDPIRQELAQLKLDEMTPKEALAKLYQWKESGEYDE